MRTLCTGLAILMLSSVAMAQSAPELTKEHELLSKNVGKRTGQMKIWAQGPTSTPMTVPFKEESQVILDGFWVITHFESGPYKGHGKTGYDAQKKKYVGTWVSNMATHLTVMEGTYDDAKHELTMKFRDFDHRAGGMVDMKSVTATVPGKPETMTMYRKDSKTDEWVVSFVMTYDDAK